MRARNDKAITHLRKVEVVIRITPDATTTRSIDQLIDELSELEAFYGLLDHAISKYMDVVDDRVAGDYDLSVDHFEVRHDDDDDDDPDEEEGEDEEEEDEAAVSTIHLVRGKAA